MTKEEIAALLEKVAMLEKQKEEDAALLAEKDALLEEASKQVEELSLSITAKDEGKYAEAYEENGVSYILKSPVIFDVEKKKKVAARDYFASHEGKAAQLSEFENDQIEKKGGTA